MQGISMNNLQMDPYWNQYWQNSLYTQQLQQAQGQGQAQANPSFQGVQTTTSPQSIPTMQGSEEKKKGKGGLIALSVATVGLGVATIIAARKGNNNNIIDGYKKMFNSAKEWITKSKTLNGKKLKFDKEKINRLKTEADVLAIGGKVGTFDIKNANSSIRKYTCNIDDHFVTLRDGKIKKILDKDGKALKADDLTDGLKKHILEFVEKIDKKDADSIAKLTDIEFIQTEDGIRKIFRAAKGTDTPAFHYGTTNWFLEKATS